MKGSTENSLNRNAEAASLCFFCKESSLKKLEIFTGKRLYRSIPFDKVACLNLQLKKEWNPAQEFSYVLPERM